MKKSMSWFGLSILLTALLFLVIKQTGEQNIMQQMTQKMVMRNQLIKVAMQFSSAISINKDGLAARLQAVPDLKAVFYITRESLLNGGEIENVLIEKDHSLTATQALDSIQRLGADENRFEVISHNKIRMVSRVSGEAGAPFALFAVSEWNDSEAARINILEPDEFKKVLSIGMLSVVTVANRLSFSWQMPLSQQWAMTR